jgi:hypothetical protein
MEGKKPLNTHTNRRNAMEIDNFVELFSKQEELHPDLAARLRDDTFGKCLHHPLMIEVIYNPVMNALINKSYLMKKEYVETKLNECDYHAYVFLHERPYRLEAFQRIADCLLAPELYWDVVASIWTDSENIFEHYNDWRRIWSPDSVALVSHRRRVMDEEELAALEALPAIIPVYRGVRSTKYKKGMSWTTDLEKAEWFAKRFPQKGRRPVVVEGWIHRSEVLAHFLGRGENEIVAFPWLVRDQKVKPIK